ncbi:hypothetical protein ACFE04_006794 [Oxalis oulophora]
MKGSSNSSIGDEVAITKAKKARRSSSLNSADRGMQTRSMGKRIRKADDDQEMPNLEIDKVMDSTNLVDVMIQVSQSPPPTLHVEVVHQVQVNEVSIVEEEAPIVQGVNLEMEDQEKKDKEKYLNKSLINEGAQATEVICVEKEGSQKWGQEEYDPWLDEELVAEMLYYFENYWGYIFNNEDPPEEEQPVESEMDKENPAVEKGPGN